MDDVLYILYYCIFLQRIINYSGPNILLLRTRTCLRAGSTYDDNSRSESIRRNPFRTPLLLAATSTPSPEATEAAAEATAAAAALAVSSSSSSAGAVAMPPATAVGGVTVVVSSPPNIPILTECLYHATVREMPSSKLTRGL